MVNAGPATDAVLDTLLPMLTPGDIVIDGGNSLFRDTQKREQRCEAKLHFVGMGVSGGEEGARFGPSLMPGGTAARLTKRCARSWKPSRQKPGPCVTHVGPDGAGHFVKMVHNGIEYADMQLIAEAYDLLRHATAAEPAQIAEVFRTWNTGRLDSLPVLYLISEKGMSASNVQNFLYRDCGLKGLSGVSNDMRELEASPDPKAKLAIDYFVYRIGLNAGMLAAALQGLDAFVFTSPASRPRPVRATSPYFCLSRGVFFRRVFLCFQRPRERQQKGAVLGGLHIMRNALIQGEQVPRREIHHPLGQVKPDMAVKRVHRDSACRRVLCMRVFAFIAISTMRRSGYFTRVFELRPVE